MGHEVTGSDLVPGVPDAHLRLPGEQIDPLVRAIVAVERGALASRGQLHEGEGLAREARHHAEGSLAADRSG